jgi:hypothetical protein
MLSASRFSGKFTLGEKSNASQIEIAPAQNGNEGGRRQFSIWNSVVQNSKGP